MTLNILYVLTWQPSKDLIFKSNQIKFWENIEPIQEVLQTPYLSFLYK